LRTRSRSCQPIPTFLFVRYSHLPILPGCLHNHTPEPLPVACSLRLLRVGLVFRAWVQTSTEHMRTESTQQTPSQETPRKARLLGLRGRSPDYAATTRLQYRSCEPSKEQLGEKDWLAAMCLVIARFRGSGGTRRMMPPRPSGCAARAEGDRQAADRCRSAA
jgi:hypothetical protein